MVACKRGSQAVVISEPYAEHEAKQLRDWLEQRSGSYRALDHHRRNDRFGPATPSPPRAQGQGAL